MESQDYLNIRYANALLPVTVLFGLFTLMGVVGNALVLLVFTLGRAYRHNNFRVFVISLGIIDLATSAFLLPAEMAKHRNYFHFEDVGMCKVKCLFNVWAGCAAALSLLVVSIDRFRKVCQPFRTQITPQLATKLCVFLSFFLSIVLSIPGAVMCGIKEVNMTNIHGNLTTVFICETEERYMKHILRSIYKYTFIILLVGVSIACVVMYVLIGRQIFKHWGTIPVSFRRSSTKDETSEFSSETFGKVRSPSKTTLERTASNLSDNNVLTNPPSSPIFKQARPPLVKQSASSFDNDVQESKKKLVKQLSTNSFTAAAKKADDAAARKRSISRQGSGFGIRRFPYKTLIWFILTLVFIVTYMLYLVLAIQVPKIPQMGASKFAIFQAFYRLYFINNIINPIVYALLDKNFRKACKTLGPRLKARFAECCL